MQKNNSVLTVFICLSLFAVHCCGALVAHLPFEGTAEDVSGNGNHGSATDGIVYVPGRYGRAIHTGSGNEYVELANEANFDFIGPMTICAWVKCPPGSLPAGTWSSIVTKESWRLIVLGQHWGVNGSHGFECQGLDPYYINVDKANNYPGIQDGLWHHITVVYDGANMMLYTDGQLNKKTGHTGTPSVCDDPVRVGGGSNHPALLPFNGYIDEVRIYDEALEPEDIVNAMNDRKPFKANNPQPREWQSDLSPSTVLSWSAPLDLPEATYRIYLGTDPNLTDAKSINIGSATRYVPNLTINRKYYWRVDAIDPDSNKIYIGNTWVFSTSLPKAKTPSPADGAKNVNAKTVLSWKPEQKGGPYKHLVFLGQSPDTMRQVASLGSDTNSYQPCLQWQTEYYWQVKEEDANGKALAGDIWRFTTGDPQCSTCGLTIKSDCLCERQASKYSCPLGVARDVFPTLPAGIVGRFDAEGRIVFNQRPKKSWDFMATGTGTTGMTVTVDQTVRMQINHADAYDGGAFQQPLGILRVSDWAVAGWASKGDPFMDVDTLRMVHDLKKSCIRVTADTPIGPVHMDIRAHIEMDVISIDIIDQRSGTQNKPTGFNLNMDVATGRDVTEDGVHLTWHLNTDSVYAKANEWSGFSMPEETDVLMGRCFGTAACFDPNYKTNTPGQMGYRIWLAADSTLGGVETWRKNVLEKINKVRALGPGKFIESHEQWWADFWKRSYFEPQPKDGDERFIRHQAAFDLYRYYIACCSSDRREFPVRFQNDLFRYNNVQHFWSVMDITALETYQSVYGAMRTGDLAAMRSRLNYYIRFMPLFKKHSQARFDHDGSVCPYETSVWGSYLYWGDGPVTYYTEKNSPYLRYSWSGNLWMLLLMCDYVNISGDLDFAESGLRSFASEVLTFFKEHYPQKDESGHIVFSPSSAGETWCGVKNAAEVICAFRTLLPRLITIAEQQGWDTKAGHWKELLSQIPPIPRGKLVQDSETRKWQILEGNLLVPAESMEDLETNGPINHQHTELFAIWPSKLYLRNAEKLKVALESYKARMWQRGTDGWNLNVVFAACLGLEDEVDRMFDFHFDVTNTFPCGLAQETSLHQDHFRGISIYPSMQGMGTTMIPVVERLMQDYADKIILLPCWPDEVPVRFAFFSPFAGRVEADYRPNDCLIVTTERPIKVTIPKDLTGILQLHVNE